MNTPVEIAVIVVVVGLMVVRRLIGEPADARRMLVIPAVLALAGLSDVEQVGQSPLSLEFLAGTGLVSALLGVLRGASIRVVERDGIVMVRYTVTTVILLVTNFAIKIGSGFILGAIDPQAEHAVGAGLALTFGVGMLVEGVTVLSKAVRTGGRVVWGRSAASGRLPEGGGTDRGRPASPQGEPRPWRGGERRHGLLMGLLNDVRDLGNHEETDDGDTSRPKSSNR